MAIVRMVIVYKFLRIAVVSLALVGCTRIKAIFYKKNIKLPNDFHVLIPLQQDYPLLSNALVQTIKSVIPKAEIDVQEGLSNAYQMAPFDEWLTKTDAEAYLKLQLRLSRSEDRPHVLAFLAKTESKIPFKIKIPASEMEGSEARGEFLFCRMHTESDDLFEKQLCKSFLTSLCGSEVSNSSKKAGGVPATPLCKLSFEIVRTADAPLVKDLKVIGLTGFALPLKVGNDYPFLRMGDVDEPLLRSLFQTPPEEP